LALKASSDRAGLITGFLANSTRLGQAGLDVRGRGAFGGDLFQANNFIFLGRLVGLGCLMMGRNFLQFFGGLAGLSFGGHESGRRFAARLLEVLDHLLGRRDLIGQGSGICFQFGQTLAVLGPPRAEAARKVCSEDAASVVTEGDSQGDFTQRLEGVFPVPFAIPERDLIVSPARHQAAIVRVLSFKTCSSVVPSLKKPASLATSLSIGLRPRQRR
jgi:hypothetical protein